MACFLINSEVVKRPGFAPGVSIAGRRPSYSKGKTPGCSVYTRVYILRAMTKPRKDSRSQRPKRVGEPPPPPYAHPPVIARVFQSGNSQAVRLPKQFRFRSKQVQVFRRGNDIVLREQPAKLSELLAVLAPLADDAYPNEIPDAPPEPVEGF